MNVKERVKELHVGAITIYGLEIEEGIVPIARYERGTIYALDVPNPHWASPAVDEAIRRAKCRKPLARVTRVGVVEGCSAEHLDVLAGGAA